MKTEFHIIITLVLTTTCVNTIQAESVNNLTDGYLYQSRTSFNSQKVFDPNAYNWLEVWFDSDYEKSSGMTLSPWEDAGFDYLLQGTSLYNYFGVPGSNQWNWNLLWQYYVPRKMSSNNYSTEYSINKDLFTKTPLLNKFGISVNPYYNGVERDFFPSNDSDFALRKGYMIKPRTVIEINTNIAAELISDNAYFHPYMNSSNIESYLDFQSGNDYTSNSKLWASWAINLITPNKYKFKMNYQSSSNGKITLSLINMKTNAVSKIFIPTNYDTNAIISEKDFGMLDLTTVPAGMYMLKLNTSNTNSFLKINKITLSNIESNSSSVFENESENNIDLINITVQNKSLNIVSKENYNINVFTINGSKIRCFNNLSKIEINLENGIYLIEFKKNEFRFVKKVII